MSCHVMSYFPCLNKFVIYKTQDTKSVTLGK